MIRVDPKRVTEKSAYPAKGLYLDGKYPAGSYAIIRNFDVEPDGNFALRDPISKPTQSSLTCLSGYGIHLMHTLQTSSARYLYGDIVYTSGATDYFKVIGSALTGGGTAAITMGNWADISTALTLASAEPCWSTALGRAFRVDGVNANYYYKDTSGAHNCGVTAPTGAPTCANTTGGSMTAGDYYVYYTYVKKDGTYIVESNPSPVGTVTVTDNAINVTHAKSSDTDVGYIRIYRNLYGYSDYYHYVTEVTNAAATTKITTADATVRTAAVMHTDYDVPPICKFIAFAGDRMWYVRPTNTTSYPSGSSQVFWSRLHEPEHVPALNYHMIDPLDNDVITGIGVIQNYLVVYKRYKMYLIDLFSQNTMTVDGVNAVEVITKQEISKKIGCVDNHTVQSVGQMKNGLIWLSDEGVYFFDGSEMKNISENRINSTIKKYLDYGSSTTWRSFYKTDKKQYHLLMVYRTPATTISSVVHFVYRLDSDAWFTYQYYDSDGNALYETTLNPSFDGNTKEIGLVSTVSSTTGTTAVVYEMDMGVESTAMTYWSTYLQYLNTVNAGTGTKVFNDLITDATNIYVVTSSTDVPT